MPSAAAATAAAPRSLFVPLLFYSKSVIYRGGVRIFRVRTSSGGGDRAKQDGPIPDHDAPTTDGRRGRTRGSGLNFGFELREAFAYLCIASDCLQH